MTAAAEEQKEEEESYQFGSGRGGRCSRRDKTMSCVTNGCWNGDKKEAVPLRTVALGPELRAPGKQWIVGFGVEQKYFDFVTLVTFESGCENEVASENKHLAYVGSAAPFVTS